ncbi:MAG: hypothetical protein JOZ70_14930 [Pseudolabrys sp.]|nr:hypothetical protein [Pseudolabrys sp.]
MRFVRFIGIALSLGLTLSTAQAARAPAAMPPQFASLQTTTDWINAYRAMRYENDAAVKGAYAIRAASYHSGLKDPESAGVFVGFIAGLLASNPGDADTLIEIMLPMRRDDQWAIVRGIAYSGLPNWKFLLRRYAARMPSWQEMIDQHIHGKLPTLERLVVKPSPTTMERMRDALSWSKTKPGKPMLEPTQTVIDTLWGHYLASGSYAPLLRLVAFLPWASDRDDAEKLTLGSMAKYTLAINAGRDPALLVQLKHLRQAPEQSKDVAKELTDVIQAAETADPGTLRKNALASIEVLKTKGPNYKKEMSTWTKVGQGALAVGCVAAAATGHIELGLPCVIGGGATNAAAYYMNER